MSKIISKTKLLATTAICTISVCANTVKADEEISILDILNNSTTKSPNISWEKVDTAGTDTIQIGDKYFKYTYTTPEDYTKVENLTENISLINPTEKSTYKYIGLGVNNPEGTDYGNIEKTVFSNNKVTATFENNGSYRDLYVYGGVIYNQGEIGDITADFINNSIDVLATNLSNNYYIYTDVYGGAIFNQGTIGDITGDFVNNSIYINQGASNKSTSYKDAIGGAIYNQGTIGNITGDFIGNSANTSQNDGYGGAIYNRGTIDDITGNFIGNSAGYAGAIYNGGTIGNITGNFIGNSASVFDTITQTAYAGAISNSGTIDSIIGTFIGNGTNQADGSAHTHVSTIYNSGTIGVLSGDFINNYINNADYSSDERVAVYNGWNSQMTLLADGSTDASNPYHQEVLFKGNYAIDEYGNKSYEALYSEGIINFESRNGGSFTFYDIIHIQDTMNLTGDGNVGIFNMYNNIYTINAPILNIQNPYIFNMINQKANTISWQGNINVEEETTLNLDVFLTSGTSDNFLFPFVITGMDSSSVITGRDKFKIGQVNIVEDMDNDVEYAKVNYSNLHLTSDSKHEQSTSGGVYSIVSDGKNLMIEKKDGKGGFAAFLADSNNIGAERTYSFTKDEDMRLAIDNGFDISGSVETDGSNLTIFGNEHTLSYLTGKNSKAMNLLEEQTAQINNLTIEGFATGLANSGSITLNNVTLKDNGTAIQNHGDIYLQGENTISGAGYAMYFKPGFKYPLLAAIVDTQYMQGSLSNMGTYEQFMAQMSANLSNMVGYEVNVTNGAEYINILVEYARQQGQVIPDDEKELIGITEAQYKEIIGLLKEYGEEHPTVGIIIMEAIEIGFDPTKMAKMMYTTDADEKSALFDEYLAEVTKNMTEEEIVNSNIYWELSDSVYLFPIIDSVISQQSGLPNPYNYTKVDFSSSKTASEYPLTGALIDMMLAQEAAKVNMDYATFLKDVVSTEVGMNVTNGANAAELLVQYGLISCTNDLSCAEAVGDYLGMPLTIDLTKAEYDKVIEVVREYGEEHPGSGFMALMLTMQYPMIPLDDMMAILYAEDNATQETLIDGLISKMIASGDLPEEYRDSAKQEILAAATQFQSESLQADTMYADLGIPSPYGYVYVENIAGSTSSVLNFAEGAILNLNSKISGADVYGLTLAGADDAIINLNSEIEKADLVLDGPTLKLSDESTNLASVNSFEVKNGTLDMQNDAVRTLIASNFKVSGALKLYVDADLANKQMDTLGEVEVTDEGSISVDGIKIISDSAETETSVEFAGESYKDKVTTTVDNVLSTDYEYAVEYDETTGEFKFVRGNKIASEEVAPNQAPSLTTNTTVAAVETVVAQIFDRDVTISADTNYGADTTDYIETSDGVNIRNDKSVWVKTFGSDDDVKVDNFNGTIDSEAYGVVGGVDSKVFTYDNGVKAAYGIYGAYVGGKQKYDDNKITQDSGYLGVSASFRKSNLFSNFTLNGGYITSKANTAWGKDEFDTKVVSVANKTGVDIKTSNGWTITPAMYVAYTGMDTEDYTNKAGVKMENEFANVVTLAPELKVRKGFDNGIGAYAKASYKHYIYDTDVKADDVLLEEMSAKPYVEYGFGVEKNWADKSGYAELTRRDGGREGWNVNLGLQFDF